MDNQSFIFTGDSQRPGEVKFPPAWQLNESQKRFIEELWLPEEAVEAPSGLVDNLTAPGQ